MRSMRRRALRMSAALFSVLGVGVLATSLAWAHPVYPSRPHLDRPVLPGTSTTSPANNGSDTTSPGTSPANTNPATTGSGTTSPGTTSPGTTSPGTTSSGTTSSGTTSSGTTSSGTTSSGTTSSGTSGSGTTAATPGTTTTTTGGGGHAAGGVLSNSTSGAGRGGRGISETTSGGHHQAGHSPVNNSSPGARATQSATGLGALRAGSPASSTPAVLRTHSGQLVFAGSLATQPRGHAHAQTPGTNVWARSHPNPGATPSPSAGYTSPGTSADPQLVIGAALLASGLVAMLAGFLVAELRRRRAPASAGAQTTTTPR